MQAEPHSYLLLVGKPFTSCRECGWPRAHSCLPPWEWPSATPRGPFPPEIPGRQGPTVLLVYKSDKKPDFHPPDEASNGYKSRSRAPAGHWGTPLGLVAPCLHPPLSLLLEPPRWKHLLGILASGSASREPTMGRLRESYGNGNWCSNRIQIAFWGGTLLGGIYCL